MTTSRWLLIITVIVLLADGVLVGQRCMYERRLAQQQAMATKADTQLVETTRELGAERVQQAKAKAKASVRATEERVHAEVQHAQGDSDLFDYLSAATAGAHPSD